MKGKVHDAISDDMNQFAEIIGKNLDNFNGKRKN
jgi:hypothetical protein